jgi:hypothetical protein
VCGKDVTGVSGLTADQVAKMTKDKYGKQMCSDCAAKAKAKAEQEAYQKTASAQAEPQDDLAAELMAEAEQ